MSVLTDEDCEALRETSEGTSALALIESLTAERDAAHELLSRIGVWSDTYGAALVPRWGFLDTYGDGVRSCKAQIKRMLPSGYLAKQAKP